MCCVYGARSTVERSSMHWGMQLEYVATILDRVIRYSIVMFVSLSSVHVKVQSVSGMSYKVPVDRNCDSLQYVGYSFALDSLQAAWQASSYVTCLAFCFSTTSTRLQWKTSGCRILCCHVSTCCSWCWIWLMANMIALFQITLCGCIDIGEQFTVNMHCHLMSCAL